MSDTNETPLTEAEEYAKTLESAGLLEPEKADDKADADAGKAAEAGTDAAAKGGEGAVAEGEVADAGKTEAAKAAEAQAEELFPGFKDLSEDAQKAVLARIEAADRRAQDYEQRWRAQHGQLAPTQRELHAARNEAKEAREKLKKLEEIKEARTEGEPTAELIKKFKEQYPEEGAALEAISKQFETRAEKLASENAALRDSIASVQETVKRQEAITARKEQIFELTQRHPDWQEIDNSDSFKAWLKSVGRSKQALANSNVAADIAEVIDDYKRDLMLAQYHAGQGAAPAAAAVTPKPGRKDADPNPTQRQSVGHSASNAGTSEADDYVATLQAAGYEI